MSELDKENERHVPKGDCNRDEAFVVMNADDFVKYSDSVDDRMAEIARNFNEHNEVKWSRWNHRRDVNDEDSESEEEPSYSRMPPKFTQKVLKASTEGQSIIYQYCDTGKDVKNKKCYDTVATDFEQDIDSYQEDSITSENNFSGQDNVQELMRKFSVIENLRQKRNLKNENLPETTQFSPSAGKVYEESEDSRKKEIPELPEVTKFSPPAGKVLDASGDNQKKDASEAFLGWIKSKMGKKDHREEDKSDNSEKSHPEEDDDEIDEIVKMLSNSSLVKDYYDVVSFPNRDEEIFQAFIDHSRETEEKKLDNSSEKPEIEVSKDVLGTEFEVIPPENVYSDDLIPDWKDDIARELRSSFDGYEIDDQSSYHDWMVYNQGM